MVGLPDSKKMEDMFSSVDRIPACDRQTDGLTDSIVRAMHTPRAYSRTENLYFAVTMQYV